MAKKKAKKKTANKKVVKNPYEGKRFFKIDLSGYGGELIVGRASEEFVEYWQNKKRKDRLGEHLQAMNEMAMYSDDMLEEAEDDEFTLDIPEGFDKDSPEVHEDAGNREYWEFDDVEHETMLCADHAQYTVTEITIDPRAEYVQGELQWQDKYSNKKNFDWSSEMFTEITDTTKEYGFDKVVVDRELFLLDKKSKLDDPVPVVMMYDSHKGTFGHLVVMTDGEDFDSNKLVISTLDNTMSTNVEYYYYDKQSLSVDTSCMDTWGKGFFAQVGWVEKQEVETNYTALLDEGWKNLDDDAA